MHIPCPCHMPLTRCHRPLFLSFPLSLFPSLSLFRSLCLSFSLSLSFPSLSTLSSSDVYLNDISYALDGMIPFNQLYSLWHSDHFLHLLPQLTCSPGCRSRRYPRRCTRSYRVLQICASVSVSASVDRNYGSDCKGRSGYNQWNRRWEGREIVLTTCRRLFISTTNLLTYRCRHRYGNGKGRTYEVSEWKRVRDGLVEGVVFFALYRFLVVGVLINSVNLNGELWVWRQMSRDLEMHISTLNASNFLFCCQDSLVYHSTGR
jgi:hypothetical protein